MYQNSSGSIPSAARTWPLLPSRPLRSLSILRGLCITDCFKTVADFCLAEDAKSASQVKILSGKLRLRLTTPIPVVDIDFPFPKRA